MYTPTARGITNNHSHQVNVSKRTVLSAAFLGSPKEINKARNAGTIKLLVSIIAVNFGPIFLMALAWKRRSKSTLIAILIMIVIALQSVIIFSTILNGLCITP